MGWVVVRLCRLEHLRRGDRLCSGTWRPTTCARSHHGFPAGDRDVRKRVWKRLRSWIRVRRWIIERHGADRRSGAVHAGAARSDLHVPERCVGRRKGRDCVTRRSRRGAGSRLLLGSAERRLGLRGRIVGHAVDRDDPRRRDDARGDVTVDHLRWNPAGVGWVGLFRRHVGGSKFGRIADWGEPEPKCGLHLAGSVSRTPGSDRDLCQRRVDRALSQPQTTGPAHRLPEQTG